MNDERKLVVNLQSIKKPKLSEILPRSLTYDAKFTALAKALDAQLEKLSGEVKNVLFIPRLDELTGKTLDLLAYQLHVDNFSPLFLDDETKRNLIRNSIAYHKRKGTRAAVNDVCAAFGNKVEIEEWFEKGVDDLEPYEFRLTAEMQSVNKELNDFLKRIWDAKNVRSWLVLRLKKRVELKAYVGVGHHKWGKKRVLKLDTVTISPNKTIDELNGRKIIITPGKVTVIRDGEEYVITDSSDKLQLKLAFPTGSRTITFNNPRSDLTADEINAVADYAIDNELLIKTNELDTVDDLTTAKLIYVTKTPILF